MATTIDAPTLTALRALCEKVNSHESIVALSGILGRIIDNPDDAKFRRLRAEKLQAHVTFSEHFERVLIGFGFLLDDAGEFFVCTPGPLSRVQRNLRGLVLDAERKETGMTAAERAAMMEGARRRAELAEKERLRIVQQAEQDREERKLKTQREAAALSPALAPRASAAAGAPAAASASLTMAELAAERAAREFAREAAWVAANGPRPMVAAPAPAPANEGDDDDDDDDDEERDE
jgi:hypothetical protein